MFRSIYGVLYMKSDFKPGKSLRKGGAVVGLSVGCAPLQSQCRQVGLMRSYVIRQALCLRHTEAIKLF